MVGRFLKTQTTEREERSPFEAAMVGERKKYFYQFHDTAVKHTGGKEFQDSKT